jgi:hypothetical protein
VTLADDLDCAGGVERERLRLSTGGLPRSRSRKPMLGRSSRGHRFVKLDADRSEAKDEERGDPDGSDAGRDRPEDAAECHWSMRVALLHRHDPTAIARSERSLLGG